MQETIANAARAHLATLPENQDGRVWHAEYASNGGPMVLCFDHTKATQKTGLPARAALRTSTASRSPARIYMRSQTPTLD